MEESGCREGSFCFMILDKGSMDCGWMGWMEDGWIDDDVIQPWTLICIG